MEFLKKKYKDLVEGLQDSITKFSSQNIMVVHGTTYDRLECKNLFQKLEKQGIKIVHFTDFESNPKYESVVKGRKLFLEEKCDTIIAIGGGSAIDVAKCIKLFSVMQESKDYTKESHIITNIPLIAVPTTAGTGSEATRFAVIYKDGEKQSINDDCILPDVQILDKDVLLTLPESIKKTTLCDALAHGIESYWCVNANKESRELSAESLSIIMRNWRDYINGSENVYDDIMKAANLAGEAINITFTTAGHALSYKITSMFGIPHGQAVIISLPAIWKKMISKNKDDKLTETFEKIAEKMGCNSKEGAILKIEQMIDELNLRPNMSISEEEISILAKSVNTSRLKNNPIQFNENELKEIYIEIFRK